MRKNIRHIAGALVFIGFATLGLTFKSPYWLLLFEIYIYISNENNILFLNS